LAQDKFFPVVALRQRSENRVEIAAFALGPHMILTLGEVRDDTTLLNDMRSLLIRAAR
jgi:hypothetical protein